MRVDSRGVEILGALLETNAEFKIFYEEEFINKIGSIGWIYDSDMRQGIMAFYDAEENAIHYKNHPASIEDAYLMAHEIMHVIRDKELNMPVVKYNDYRYGDLAMSLKSLLEDQNVDRILRDKYNINLVPFYMTAIDTVEGRSGEERKEKIFQVWNGFVLANTMLKWDLITDQGALRRWRDHLKWYRKRYPNNYRIGKNISKIIRAIGLEDVEKHRDIAIKLIDKYDLKGILIV